MGNAEPVYCGARATWKLLTSMMQLTILDVYGTYRDLMVILCDEKHGVSFAPMGLNLLPLWPHGLRRGLHLDAASRLA